MTAVTLLRWLRTTPRLDVEGTRARALRRVARGRQSTVL